MNAIVWGLRVALAATFAWAAATKIADPAGFLAAIRTYRALPDSAAVGLALWLPWLELCAAGALFSTRHRRGALALLFALSLVFLGALSQAWIRGLDVSCGCFGRPVLVRGPAYLNYLGRDVLLLVVIGGLLWRERPAAPPGCGR